MKEQISPLTKSQWKKAFCCERNGVKYTNEEWLYERFKNYSVFLSNGIGGGLFQFRGIYSTDTGVLFKQALKNAYNQYLSEFKRNN